MSNPYFENTDLGPESTPHETSMLFAVASYIFKCVLYMIFHKTAMDVPLSHNAQQLAGGHFVANFLIEFCGPGLMHGLPWQPYGAL